MRRIKLLIVISILSVSMYGCSKKSDFTDSANQNILSYIVENYDYYNNGVVYGKTTAAFLDFDTMETSILCPVPNCTHQSLDCLAKKAGNTPVFYKDNIYYFISNNGEVKETTKGKIFFIDSKLMKTSINLNYSSWSKKNLSNHIITYFKKFFRFHLKSEARV